MTDLRGSKATRSELIDAIRADFLAARIHDFEIPVDARDEPDLAWSIGDLPFPYRSVVTEARFAAPDADRRIAEIVAAFRRRGLGLVWWHAPHDTPADLPQRLIRAGLRREGASPAMAAVIDDLSLDEPAPRGLEIKPVVDDPSIASYADVIWESLELPRDPALAAAFRSALVAAIGPRLAREAVPRRFLAFLDGRAVGTSRVYLGDPRATPGAAAPIAGLYSITTVPDARGRGIGRATTLAALGSARDAGARIAVLQSSDLGIPVYRRLGFETVFTYDVYELPRG